MKLKVLWVGAGAGMLCIWTQDLPTIIESWSAESFLCGGKVMNEGKAGCRIRSALSSWGNRADLSLEWIFQ